MGADLRLKSRQGRGLLVGTVLGSGLALLDATVVNVALPHIGVALHTTLAGLQWTVNAYTLMLAAFVLLGGALGDRYGRRRIFLIGMAWFTGASVLCGLSVGVEWLVAARALQGMGAALLTPGSLSLINATLHPDDRGRGIGIWAGFSGIAGALGPVLGGWVIDTFDWRWIFFLNVPVALVVLAVTLRYVPESRAPAPEVRGFDVAGALLGAAGLAGVTYALVAGHGAIAWAAAAAGVAAFVGFVVVERRSPHPMMPLGLFRSVEFSVINAVTLVVYAGLSGVLFLLVLQLQVTAGFSAIAAGAANAPIPLLILLGSPRAGALGKRYGPRAPLTVGCLLAGLGILAMLRIGPGAVYWRDVLPAVTLFGLGLTVLVAPLTASVLAAVDVRYAGVSSGVNNAVARAGGLLAVAALPLLVGLSGEGYALPAAVDHAYRQAIWYCAGLLGVGAAMSWLLLPRRAPVSGAP
ncbi:MAG: hypothetical protein QOD04_6003, partial [Pseudonocardiales bacterium]|nr:hypothetical protein [Pseudonocardiales bacterium]